MVMLTDLATPVVYSGKVLDWVLHKMYEGKELPCLRVQPHSAFSYYTSTVEWVHENNNIKIWQVCDGYASVQVKSGLLHHFMKVIGVKIKWTQWRYRICTTVKLVQHQQSAHTKVIISLISQSWICEHVHMKGGTFWLIRYINRSSSVTDFKTVR